MSSYGEFVILAKLAGLSSGGGGGTPGADGATWYTGTGAPASGLGKDTDLYLDTASGNVYKRVGTWGVVASLKGANGANGNTIISTTGAPLNTVGNNGDFAIDSSAKLIYGPKAGGSWPAGITLGGANGTNGNTILTTSGAPSSGTGANGDYALDPTNKVIYGPKASGTWPGGISFAGTPGANGNTIVPTTGAPSNAVGNNGDFAIDSTNKMFYGPKASGVWPAGVTLGGTNGTNGNTILTVSGQPSNSAGVNGDYAIDPTAKLIYGPKAAGAWPAAQSLGGSNGNTVLTTSGTPASGTGANGDYAYDPTTKTMYGPKSGGAWPAGVVLAGTSGNTVLTTSGQPASGTGNNGDYAYDPTAKTMYGPKSGGAWPAGLVLAGTAGTNGNTVLNGTGAPSGGNNGDFYINTTTNVLYGPKAGGAWPGTGVSMAGTNGTNGNTVLSTSGAPASGTGNNGDFAYDATAKIMYGPKASGAWPAGVSLAGTAGAAGARWYTSSGAPASGFGAVGDYCIDTASALLTFYNKASSTVWNVVSTLRGTAGNTVLNGTGAPAAGTGANGDFYVDTAANVFYGPKAAGAWPGSGISMAGTAATISLGTVSTGAAGSSVTITNSGTSQNAVLNFTIPKGDTGSPGTADTSGIHAYMDTADIISIRNGTNQQQLRVFRTTDGTNGDYAMLGFSGGIAYFGSDKIGSGTPVAMRYRLNGADLINFNASGFLPTTNLTYACGGVNNRWKSVYTNGFNVNSKVVSASYTMSGPTEPFEIVMNGSAATTITTHSNPEDGEMHMFMNAQAFPCGIVFPGPQGNMTITLQQNESLILKYNAGGTAWDLVANYDPNYPVAAFVAGKVASEQCLILPATERFIIPVGAVLSKAKFKTAATASTVYTLYKNGTSFGTMTVAAGATTATFSVTTATVFDPASNDYMEIIGPSTADSTLANGTIMLMGQMA